MTSSSDQRIIFELVVRSTHPALLEGLDVWLRLGLLSDGVVRRLCREQLVCPLPEVAVGDEVELEPATPEPAPEPALARPVGLIAQIAQSFMAEISVVWLLFLGVFMVVVSSGVLAASQWRNFSPIGQYAILLGYTLAFWAASVWTGKQPALRLTARMLQISTLLLIPVNFWMMDGFRLWSSALGLAVTAIAALLLTLIIVRLLKPATIAPDNNRLILGTTIALSYLHWGWGWDGFPLIATYVGTIGASLALVYLDQRVGRIREIGEAEEMGSSSRTTSPENLIPAMPGGAISPTSPFTITILLSTLLLIVRAVFVAQVPFEQLGLAAGICGWQLCWLSRWDERRRFWSRVGAGLLLLGWAVTVTVSFPWQAIAISGLGLWLLADYLKRLGQAEYLNLGFLVGLQMVWLLWQIVPFNLQQTIVKAATQLAGPELMPLALLGLWFFPYLVVMLWLASWLRGLPRSDLARQAERLALGLGLVLTVLSAGNSLVRSLNLALSAVTLAAVTQRRVQPEPPLIYLTHGVGLTAIGAAIYQIAPRLSLNVWAGILLLGVLAEWSISVLLSAPVAQPDLALAPSAARFHWQHSTWYFGLGLAMFSCGLLRQAGVTGSTLWSAIWLVVPLALTVLGSRRRFFQRSIASWFSVLALLLAQLLLFDFGAGRLVGLGAATGLMLVNTDQLRRRVAAVLTVGFGLGFAAVAIQEALTDRLTVGLTVNLLAIAILLLWLLWGWLSRRSHPLAGLYQPATDGWAILLVGVLLVLLTLSNLVVYLKFGTPNWQYVSAAALLVVATSYRSWRRSPNPGFYAIAWSVELLATGIISLTGASLDVLATVNVALGLATQLLGDWQIRQTKVPTPSPDESELPEIAPSLSWYIIPLLYAAVAVILQHRSFTASTGLYTLAAAVIVIGVGRREPFRPLMYLSLLGVSFAAYELLIYQLLQAPAGNAGDGLVLMAGLAALIAIVERLLLRWLLPYLRLTSPEILAVAHLHWALGSTLMPIAIASSLSTTGEWLWLTIATILATYALVMGRLSAHSAGASLLTWTYAGIIEALLTITYLLYLRLPDPVLRQWAGAIAVGFASVLYLVPWQRYGWNRRPWRNTAIVLPAIVTLVTVGDIAIQGLLIVAAFYAWLARAERQVRLSYISILLAGWVGVRLLRAYEMTEPIWYAALLSVALLYMAQVDPALRLADERQNRHLLRCLATGLLCGVAVYQSEVGILGILPVVVSLLSAGLALVFVAVGLALRVRAFLYVGTVAFMVQVLRQLWLFINDYSLLLWAIGIVLGLAFIWIAATFEARRTQITALVQYWATELEQWD